MHIPTMQLKAGISMPITAGRAPDSKTTSKRGERFAARVGRVGTPESKNSFALQASRRDPAPAKAGRGYTQGSSSRAKRAKARESSVVVIEDDDGLDLKKIADDFGELTLFLLRIGAASMMIHHGQEKFISGELFTKFVLVKHFAFLPGPPMLWTKLTATIQLIFPGFLIAGVFSRAAAVGLFGTMMGASFYHVTSTGLEGYPFTKLAQIPIFHNYSFETAILYVSIYAYFVFNGPGRISVAEKLGWNEDDDSLPLKGIWRQ